VRGNNFDKLAPYRADFPQPVDLIVDKMEIPILSSYTSYFLAAHSEKLGIYKIKQGGISKPALLCRAA